MKKQILTTALIVTAGIGLCLIRPAQSQQVEHGHQPAAVIFGTAEDQQGWYIYSPQSSQNAPKLQDGSNLADNLEFLLMHKFKIQNSDGGRFILIRD